MCHGCWLAFAGRSAHFLLVSVADHAIQCLRDQVSAPGASPPPAPPTWSPDCTTSCWSTSSSPGLIPATPCWCGRPPPSLPARLIFVQTSHPLGATRAISHPSFRTGALHAVCDSLRRGCPALDTADVVALRSLRLSTDDCIDAVLRPVSTGRPVEGDRSFAVAGPVRRVRHAAQNQG